MKAASGRFAMVRIAREGGGTGMHNLEERVAFVTGGASGLGLGMVTAFLPAGTPSPCRARGRWRRRLQRPLFLPNCAFLFLHPRALSAPSQTGRMRPSSLIIFEL